MSLNDWLPDKSQEPFFGTDRTIPLKPYVFVKKSLWQRIKMLWDYFKEIS